MTRLLSQHQESVQQRLDTSDISKRIAGLRQELEVARMLSVHDIASSIESVGFECIRCGDCCTGPDLDVFVFPSEIGRICHALGEETLQVAWPPATGEWDSKGNYHTLEWRLRRCDGNCIFYSSGCRIYSERPLLCRTYPFYIDEGALKFSECRGLGRSIAGSDAILMAEALKERYVTEIMESIALLSQYRDFVRGSSSADGVCIVHDSFGEHRILWDDLHGLRETIFRKRDRSYYSKEDKAAKPQ